MWASGAAARVATRGANLMVSIDLRPQAASAIPYRLPKPASMTDGSAPSSSSESELRWEWACYKTPRRTFRNPLTAPIIA